MLRIMVLALLTEALVELFFKAAPIQGFRKWMIRRTPFLEIEEQHLMECKYCTSVWAGFFVMLLYPFMDYSVTKFIIYSIITARLSNFVHIIFSTLKDYQRNLILRR